MEDTRKVEIYQVKDDEAHHKMMFRSYDYAQRTGISLSIENYDKVYECERPIEYSLNSIYEEFNIRHPKDFKAHSLSVSDVIVLTQDGKVTAHFVDDFGFKELPDFFKTDITDEPYPEFIGRRLRDIMTERLPQSILPGCEGGVAGCPSDYSYFNRNYDCTADHAAYDNCSHENCTACWNQIYTGSRKEPDWKK